MSIIGLEKKSFIAAKLRKAIWGEFTHADIPATHEFGCRVGYIDYGRATIERRN